MAARPTLMGLLTYYYSPGQPGCQPAERGKPGMGKAASLCYNRCGAEPAGAGTKQQLMEGIRVNAVSATGFFHKPNKIAQTHLHYYSDNSIIAV